MNRIQKVMIAGFATVGIAVASMAAPAFASPGVTNDPAAQMVVNGCVTAAQLEADAATAIANWSNNEQTLGSSAPAGLTVNGVWYPAGVLTGPPWSANIFDCPPAGATA